MEGIQLPSDVILHHKAIQEHDITHYCDIDTAVDIKAEPQQSLELALKRFTHLWTSA